MLNRFLAIGFLLLLAGGCAATRVRHEVTQVTAKGTGLRTVVVPVRGPLQAIDSTGYDNYVNGLLFEEQGDLPNAVESYRAAWKYCPESATISLAYVQALVHLRQFPQALQALDQVNSPTADHLALKAFCYRQTGDPERAKETYLSMVRLDSTKNVGYMFLTAYYQQQKNLDSAVWALQHLSRTLPDNPEVLNELGKVYIEKGDRSAAKESYRRSLELLPATRNMDALMSMADLFQRDQQPDSARVMFEGALQSDPENALLHKELSRLYLAQDSVTLALPHLRAVARLEPTDFAAQRRLAIVLMSFDSLKVADSILTNLISVGDTDPASHFYLGRVAALEQNFLRARDEFRLVTERVPNFPDGWLSLGFTYRRLKQPDVEIQTYQEGLLQMQKEPDAIELYFALGAAFEQSGLVDSSVAAFQAILEHNPDHGPSLNYLGYTLADRGLRLDYARDLLARAVKLEPNNPAYLDSYGWVFYRMGDFKQAVHYLQAAANLDTDPVIYDHLGDAFQAKGESDKAREWWQKALDRLPDNEAIKKKLNR